MKATKYQQGAKQTALYRKNIKELAYEAEPDETEEMLRISYCVLGLVGEAGELANKYKKILRDSYGVVGPTARQEFAAELGDVMWYVAMLADELGIDLDAVLHNNLEKLRSRQERGKLQGSGDER